MGTESARSEVARGRERRPAAAPRRGRPAEMSREAVLDRIRRIGGKSGQLFRVHLRHAALYARARRCFGSWAAAVRAAGLDYPTVVEHARRRSVRARRRQRRVRRSPSSRTTPGAR